VRRVLHAPDDRLQRAQVVFGNSTTLDLAPFRDETALDSNSLEYAARVSQLTAWVGLQLANQYCVGRIANLTVAVPLTDAMLAIWLDLFPVGYRPDAIFCSRRSRAQLRTSRTALQVNMRGAGNGQSFMAETPTSTTDGIPIYVTDSIGNADARET
jgi:hypothetical protein